MKKLIFEVPRKATPPPNPLAKYSLLGSADELEKRALEQKPLLGRLCLSGEATVWYARYGTGKTALMLHLLMEAIQSGRIEPDNVIVVNADDSEFGLAEKVRLLQDLGAHMLAPGHRGFEVGALVKTMEEMVIADTARGVFIAVDTLKKFVDVMDKKAVRAFTSGVRRFVSKGGTFLALAHTNKRTDKDGKPVPEGTADVLSDFDCAYVLDVTSDNKVSGERTIEFACVKSRGRAALKAYYVYDPDPDIPYVERLCTIREVEAADDEYGDRFSPKDVEAEIIAAIELSITHGTVTKMAIAGLAAKASNSSRRGALKVLEAYTGDDPAIHRWNYTRREHGRMVYALLVSPPA
ncbi:MAG: AAA family ATPase [Actinobacteria bacterium]|nr:AAA family ATPase [Actinomycetota bacterium]